VRLCRELSGHTTAQVVAYLERRRDELVTREGPAVLDRPDVVQLMTVHGAKGLEFPVVFVPEANTAPYVPNTAVRWRGGEGVSFTLERREGDDERPRPAFYAFLSHRERSEEAEEHLRLFYVASTRAADYLYLSGEATGRGGWISEVSLASQEGDLRDVEFRAPVDAAVHVVQRRPVTPTLTVPDASSEVAFTPELLARPPVIPIRTSTPATAIRTHEVVGGARGDGLGLVRGRIVHRAIEAAFKPGAASVAATVEWLTAEEAVELDECAREELAAEATELVERFLSSPEAGAVRESPAAYFELPFAWDWSGIPVHGQLDLVYQDPSSGKWWVVDFKTDRVEAGSEADAARPYLVQLGIYATALEAATGVSPRAALQFLRSGGRHEVSIVELESALSQARSLVDIRLLWGSEDSGVFGEDES